MVYTDRLPWSPPAAARCAVAGPRTRVDQDTAEIPPRSGALGLLRSPALRRLWACCIAFEAGWMGFTFMLPIVGTQLGFSASRIGLVAGAAGFMLFLTRACMTPLLRRFTPWQLLIAGLAIGGTGFAGLGFADEFLWMVAGAGLIGLGQGACSPMVTALIYENAPVHEKGEAIAMRTMISSASQCTAPLVAGAISAAMGAMPVFLALAAGMLGTALSSRRRWRARRKQS